MESWIAFFSWHAMTKLHAMKKNYLKKKDLILTPFAMMYMFLNYICMKHINAHIHQGLNLRTHGSTPRF